MERMYDLGPEFIDVTWGAGGASSNVTSEIVSTAQSVYGLETMMHMTCTNMPRDKIDIGLKVRVFLSKRNACKGEGKKNNLTIERMANRRQKNAAAKIFLP